MQIFVSYARDDNATPPELASAKGFVSYLHEQLRFEFTTNHGQPRPSLWQDARHIDRGEQFDPVIAKALAESSLLLVVLSRNWLYRPYCRYELDAFAQRWASEHPLALKRRVVVVAKNHVHVHERPPLLQGQEAYSFFELEEPALAGQEYSFFERGQVRDNRYFETIKALGSYLWRLSQRTDAAPAEPAAARAPEVATRARSEAPRPGPARRTVYLGKPAADVRQAYQRVVEELQHRGYDVVPPPTADIPQEEGAESFVDAATAQAEVSIHLLGDRLGYAPENAEPIAKLQLTRAGLRTQPSALGEAKRGFRRIIWAPKVLADSADPAQPASERDPLAVVAKFGGQLPGDKVEGSSLSDFVTFLIQYLDSNPIEEKQPQLLHADASVYLYHQLEDTRYAIELAKALRQRSVKTVFPALEGDPAQLEAMHRKKLADCDGIVLCWAKASEVWVHAQTDGLRDWREFGRKQKFSFRGVVAGPPPGIRKEAFIEFPPSDEIDVVLDLTGAEPLKPEALDRLVQAAHTEAE